MELDDRNSSSETIIMATLSTLTPSHLSQLTHHLSSVFHHHSRRVSALLSSPTLFSLTLHHLHTLSLHHKSLLISRHLLSNLSLLAHHIMQQQQQQQRFLPPPRSAAAMMLRDLDVVLLLLLLCELHQHDAEALDSPPSRWRIALCHHAAKNALTLTNMGVSNSEVLVKYVELVAKCKNFVNAVGCGGGGGGGDGKDGREVAAAVAAVVALPSVEVKGNGGGWECVICKEEMKERRDVCEMPCQHLFHWICILPWLEKRNTCPCCRYKLPTDDVPAEIQRLWEVFAKMSAGSVA